MMRALFSGFRNLFKSEVFFGEDAQSSSKKSIRGQTTIEYIVILSVAVTGSILLSRTVVRVLDKGILRFGSALEKDLKTGRSSLDVYKN